MRDHLYEIAILQATRLLVGWEVTVEGAPFPRWPNAIAAIVFGFLALVG
jgi:hypothetical protein